MTVMDNDTIGYVEGDICGRNGCAGVIAEHRPDNCYCHIDPPCGACTAPRGYCPVCDWQEKNDPLVVMEISTIYLLQGFVERRKRVLDPTKIDYRIEPHSNSSQLCIGVYPPGTTAAEVEARVKGTFGGGFKKFGDGKFEYVAYTD
jgi:hypothetical protein